MALYDVNKKNVDRVSARPVLLVHSLCSCSAIVSPLGRYGLYALSCATFVCYVYAISLSIKLRNFDLSNLKKFMADFQVADKVSKAGICLEMVMVCTVSSPRAFRSSCSLAVK